VFSLMSMTDMAGGTFYRVMGQPDRFFGFIAEATSGIYHLGVEVPSNADVKKDLSVSAHVKRSGLTVRANHVAMLPGSSVAVPVAARLTDAVTKGLSNYGVPMTLAVALRRGAAAGTIAVGANVEIPSTAEAPLTVMYGLMDDTGRVQTGRETIAAAPTTDSYRISLSLPVAAGQYRLRFAVADAAGRVGSVDAPIAVALPAVGPFTASDVVLSWSSAMTKPRFLALAGVPMAATSLQAFLELYPAAGSPASGSPAATPPVGSDVKVRWTIVGASGPRPGDQTVTPIASADRLTAAVQWPLETLPPGEYELHADVLISGRVAGTVTTTFRKEAREGLQPRDLWISSASAAAR
jgi:hypothetical protein